MKKITILLLLISMSIGVVYADNSGKTYISADLGSASFTNANITINGTRNTYPNPGAIILAVGHHFTPAFALEAGYSKFGKSTLIGSTGDTYLETSSVTLAAVGTLQASSDLDFFAKLGLSSNSFTQTLTGNLVFSDGSKSNTGRQSSVLLGLGGAYHINEQTNIHIQYQNYGDFSSNTNPLSVSSFTVGVGHNF